LKQHPKILILRFSSFGDIVQCLSVVSGLRCHFPNAEIHWACRSEFAPILQLHPEINRIWSLPRKSGWNGLYQLGKKLQAEGFTHIYDAHRSLRSLWLMAQLKWSGKAAFAIRSKQRWKRFLFFHFRVSCLPQPFKGMKSFQKPLQKWGVAHFPPQLKWNFPADLMKKMDLLIQEKFGNEPFIALAPSAAWPLKRWPADYWKKLIQQMPKQNFAILGGPQDRFCAEIAAVSGRAHSFAGALSLSESCYFVYRAAAFVSGDTGILHVADIFQKKGVAIIGPTAFGFPTSQFIHTLTVELPCRPCSKDGRGRCRREKSATTPQCLRQILPETVERKLTGFL